MRRESAFDRVLVVGATLCLVTTFLAGCMATAAVTVVSQTVKTTAKAAGTAARLTMDGARVASHTITKPFRKNDDENYR